MQQDLYLLRSFKIGIIIFIPLAIIISLFPPSNWNIPTNRKNDFHYHEIEDLLPMKKYALIFENNKKYFIIGDYSISRKYHEFDQLKQKEMLADAIDYKIMDSGVDSFFTHKFFAYKPVTKKTRNKLKIYHATWEDFGEVTPEPSEQSHYRFKYSKLKSDQNYTEEDKIRLSVNFDSIKVQYLMNPNSWTTKRIRVFDKKESFKVFQITKPKYFLLEKRLILSELLVNYLLAFFLSISLGLIYIRIKERKRI